MHKEILSEYNRNWLRLLSCFTSCQEDETNTQKMEDIRLFSYKMKNDSGFAPNPFHGILTLANCKPCIRKCKKKGDWIAGFTSKNLNGDNIGKEKLIYLMKVTNKITYFDYWNDPLYELKKPNLLSTVTIDKAGDNIYKPNKENAQLFTDFEQIPNKNHNEEKEKIHDLNGKNVLVSKCFYYFGSSPIEIDNEIRPCIPIGQSAHGSRTHDIEKAKKFISFVANYVKDKPCIQPGIYAFPHKWENKGEETISENFYPNKTKKGCSPCR